MNAPAPLPADLDTLSKRALVALCDKLGVHHTARATADDLRTALRDADRITSHAYHYMEVQTLREEYEAKRPLVPASEAAQTVRESLWGLANLFSRVHESEDTLLYSVQAALPVLAAYCRDDARVSKADLKLEVETLMREVERIRQNRIEAEEYATFTLGDAHRRLTSAAGRAEARKAARAAARGQR